MSLNPEMWQWLYLPLTLVGLCLCLHFCCFTKRNLLAWLASLIYCYLCAELAGIIFPVLQNSTGFCLAYTVLNIAFMMVYFYGIRKRPPFSEVFSFTLLTSVSFGIVGGLIVFFLWSFGILH